jgi:hypothetical protein
MYLDRIKELAKTEETPVEGVSQQIFGGSTKIRSICIGIFTERQ